MVVVRAPAAHPVERGAYELALVGEGEQLERPRERVPLGPLDLVRVAAATRLVREGAEVEIDVLEDPAASGPAEPVLDLTGGLEDGDRGAGLLPHLADRRLLGRLAAFEMAFGQLPTARPARFDEEHVAPVQDDAAGGVLDVVRHAGTVQLAPELCSVQVGREPGSTPTAASACSHAPSGEWKTSAGETGPTSQSLRTSSLSSCPALQPA